MGYIRGNEDIGGSMVYRLEGLPRSHILPLVSRQGVLGP